jgi:hypothetical protein
LIVQGVAELDGRGAGCLGCCGQGLVARAARFGLPRPGARRPGQPRDRRGGAQRFGLPRSIFCDRGRTRLKGVINDRRDDASRRGAGACSAQ